MPYLVVVIAAHPKSILDPVKERNFGIGIMSAYHQDDGVDQYQPVCERGQGKAFSCRDYRRQTESSGKNFEEPGEIIVRPDTGPDKDRRED